MIGPSFWGLFVVRDHVHKCFGHFVTAGQSSMMIDDESLKLVFAHSYSLKTVRVC